MTGRELTARVLVVGGGILGTMHARAAVEAGCEVLHVEREPDARGASVRNFGLVWVSGRAAGPELELAVRARELWEKVSADVPGTGFRANGSLTVVTTEAERAVLEEVSARPDAEQRGFELLDADAARRRNPVVGGQVLAALYAARDAAVEPRLVPAALRQHLLRSGRYTFVAGREVVDAAETAAGVRLVDASGQAWDGDAAILCTGAWHRGLAGQWLAGQWLDDQLPADDRPPLVRRVRLHMMQTAPLGEVVPTSLADADSLRYYPAFAGPALDRLPAPDPEGAAWGMQLLLVQRQDGGLTIGDTHLYHEPFGFDVEETPYRLLAQRAERMLGRPLPPIERRWAGVYSQLVPGVDANAAGERGMGVYLHHEVLPGVHLVTGPGGRGMTLSPVIAERTLAALSLP